MPLRLDAGRGEKACCSITAISPPGPITLNEVHDITLAATIGSNSETMRKRSSSTSVGLSFGGGGQQAGLAFNLAVSRSNGWSNG